MIRNTTQIDLGSVQVGGTAPLVLIAGPCVIEGRCETMGLAEELKAVALDAGVPLIFKASYDKANRTSVDAFRGPGLQAGLEILAEIKNSLHLPVLSDVHRFEEVGPAAEILDIIQIPAFLCRQTDLIVEAARTGRVLNIKKGQFMAPRDMRFAVEKALSTGNRKLLLTERGACFGYNNLIVDMRSLVIMREYGFPVVFDATHSVQLPGGLAAASGGERDFAAPLSRAAAAVGIDALFLEVHADPGRAKCDGPNALRLSDLGALLKQVTVASGAAGQA